MGMGRNILKSALDVTESGIRIVVAAPLIKNDEAELYFQNMQLGRSVKRLAKVIWSLATEEGSCCAGAKATEQTKAQCSMAKQAKAGTCSMTGKVATKEVKPVLQSPKALADAR